MVFLNLYEDYLRTQILGLLLVLGIFLLILLALYLDIRKTKFGKIISGIISIILGLSIIFVAIWGDIGWEAHSENGEYRVLGITFEYPSLLYISLIIGTVLITRGIILIHIYRIKQGN
jgi:hypothetical protein